MLDCSALDRNWKHSNTERRLKNLELLNQSPDQTLIEFGKDKQNFHEKYDVTIMTEQNVKLNY